MYAQLGGCIAKPTSSFAFVCYHCYVADENLETDPWTVVCEQAINVT